MATDYLQIELKFGEAADGSFTGIASSFGNVDLGGDVIAAGAFTKTVNEHKSRGATPPLLWSHDLSAVIGKIDTLTETKSGLEITGRLSLESAKGAEIYALAKMGAVSGLSIGYSATKSSRDAKGVRTINEANLYEVSFVALPMNPQATVTSVKGKSMSDNSELAAKIEALESKTAVISDLEKKLADAEKRSDDLEVKLNRGGAHIANDAADKVEKKAFATFLRLGREGLAADEVKSLRTSDDTAGGVLAPAEFSREVDKNVVQFSPVRLAARVGQTASGSVIIPKRTGAPTGGWVGETETRPEAQATYGQAEIAIAEMAAYVDVSNKLLEDSAIDVAGEVSFDLAEEFGRLEGAAFVAGNGVKKPFGFLSDSNVASSNSGNASAITADGLISLIYALAPFYRGRGVWMMNGATLAAVRKLKDGQSQYLWQPGLTAGQPETLLGRPVIEAVDMPDIAAGSTPVIFGDFASGYRIYDRVSVSVLRDPYSVAHTGLTRFHARRRVGGAVVRAEALRKLKISA
jgi:HK97 family phage major capsid protein/HK97 family phage prohead protease